MFSRLDQLHYDFETQQWDNNYRDGSGVYEGSDGWYCVAFIDALQILGPFETEREAKEKLLKWDSRNVS